MEIVWREKYWRFGDSLGSDWVVLKEGEDHYLTRVAWDLTEADLVFSDPEAYRLRLRSLQEQAPRFLKDAERGATQLPCGAKVPKALLRKVRETVALHSL